jgi:adenine-specific DNA-methyltransferase
MPTLHWIGKDKVINHHLDVPFKVLEHSYGFDNGTQTDQETNSGNKIIQGRSRLRRCQRESARR